MYDIISSIIDHTYSSASGEQQYIYYICAVLIPLFTIYIFDILRSLLRYIVRRR